MATARSRRWVKLVAGLLLGSAAGPLGGETAVSQAFAEPAVSRTQPAQPMSASAALRQAGTLQQKGRFEDAALLLRQANGRVAELSAAERQELARLWHENFACLQQRRAAIDLLLEAEQEMNVGRQAEAARCLNQLAEVAAWLPALEQARYRTLTESSHTVVRAVAPTSADGANQSGAREKLKLARKELGDYRIDEAERLAREAEALNASWGKTEDSPRKVLEEVARLRTDGRSLLAGARHWLQRRDYDRAEKLAVAAEKQGTGWSINPFADTPTRALKDIRAARGKGVHAGSRPTGDSIQQVTARVHDQSSMEVKAALSQAMDQHERPADRKADEARRLLHQGRRALQARDIATARNMAEQALAMKADLAWWEDTGSKLLADVNRADKHGPADATGPVKSKEEAVALLKQGRTLYHEGKLDEALAIATRLKGQASIRWGLFEPTPDSLLRDAEQARSRRDQHMAGKILAEGRRLLASGDHDGAARAAEQAQKLHGSYSIFDFGDRPTKLLADVAQARQKHGPRDRTTELAHRNSTGNPATQAQILLNDARTALRTGESAKAVRLAEQAQQLQKQHNLQLSESPEVILAEAQRTVGATPYGAALPGTLPKKDAAVTTSKKPEANKLLATARQLQEQGKLVEARGKAQDALLLGADFGPTEDSPELAIQQINDRAAREVARLVNEASETLVSSSGTPAETASKVEPKLAEARSLAVAFGLDTQPIDVQTAAIARLKGLGTTTVGTTPATLPLPGPGGIPEVVVQNPTKPTAPNAGKMLLDNARLELRKGELSTARKMAEEAAQGSFGVQDEALSILRSIDAEESRQRNLTANRSFDAARQAFQRGEFTYAGSLIAKIDVRQLDPIRQGHLREMMMTPQMQPSSLARTSPVTPIPTTGDGSGPRQVRHDVEEAPMGALGPIDLPGRVQVTDQKPTEGTGTASTTVAAKNGILETTAAMREIKFQQMRDQGLKTQSEATEKFKTGQYDLALEMLQEYLKLLNDTDLEANQTSLLRRSTESRLQQFRILKAQQELVSRNGRAHENAHAAIGRSQMAELHKQKKIEELMKQSTALLKEGKYLEAERTAMQAHEIDPDNAVVSAMVFIAKRQRRGEEYAQIKSEKENMVLGVLNDAEREGPVGPVRNGIEFDPARSAIAQKRTPRSLKLTTKGLREREIESKLNTPVTLNFKDVPLYSVLQDLQAYHNIPIWPNRAALEEAGISLDRPVTIQVGNLSLKSALNLLLNDAHLTWVIRDEVLQVTTPADARGKLETRTIDVTDLVIPIHNFGVLPQAQAPQPSMTAFHPPMGTGPGATPVQTPLSLLNGQEVGTPGGATLQNNGGSVTKGQTPTQEKELIRLIQNTIAPTSWREMGGPGTMEFLPLGNALVINQTLDIQEQVADLLAALRRLQDQEVAVEVRFITITEDFYERIGVNFNVNIINDQAQKYAQQLTTGAAQPSPNFNAFNPSHLVAGITPAGSLTNDLSIPITNQTFWQTIPQFGGYPGVGVGGVTMGLAFLSDIQVFLFLEAVQGDVRNNVMQAPKLTLFNGQTANLTVGENRLFVTGTRVALINGNPVFQPQITNININTTLLIQAVITGDRRFVRLSINPFLTNQIPGPVPAFPVVVPIFPQQGVGVFSSPPDPIVFTQFIQQPGTTFVSVGTTVMVPDGGTVLMGGLKRLSENRTEYGAPILSKIPAINRLFRNVGYGREAASLLLMVTPRIIIQEEEEERATGYRNQPLIGSGP